ncbi:hypothetical protein LHU43_004762 [Escherichia coli]|nr:hypothetical protein [Escherichia coli]EII6895655.1 hypothetical protein [Escherichia coli]
MRFFNKFHANAKSDTRVRLSLISELYNQAIIDFEAGDIPDVAYSFRACLRNSVELLNDPYARLDSYEMTVLTRYISLCNDFISCCDDIVKSREG